MVYSVVLTCMLLCIVIFKSIKAHFNKRKVFLLLFFIVLGLLSAFRYQNSHSDFMTNYIHIIDAYNMSWKELLMNDEWLHQVIRKLIAIIFNDPQWYFILSSLFIVGIHLNCAYKYAHSFYLFVLLYYTIFSYFTSNNITRQAIAVSIMVLSWKSLLNKNKLQFVVLVLIAFFIHTSTIFFVPLYFLCNVKIKEKSLWIYFLFMFGAVGLSASLMNLLQRFVYSNYTSESYGMTAANPIFFVFVILSGYMFVLCVKYWTYDNEKTNILVDENNFNRFKSFILFGTLIYMICITNSVLRILLFSRIAMYFSPCVMICIDRGIQVHNQKEKKLILYLLLIFSIVWFSVSNASGKLTPTPYEPFWKFPYRRLIY